MVDSRLLGYHDDSGLQPKNKKATILRQWLSWLCHQFFGAIELDVGDDAGNFFHADDSGGIANVKASLHPYDPRLRIVCADDDGNQIEIVPTLARPAGFKAASVPPGSDGTLAWGQQLVP